MVQSKEKKAKSSSLEKCHARYIYSSNFICQHTVEYIKVHYAIRALFGDVRVKKVLKNVKNGSFALKRGFLF